MQEMIAFMKQFPSMEHGDEKMQAMKKLKEKHFADLKALLKNDPALYEEVSKEMEAMMNMMMTQMQKKHSMMKLPFVLQTRIDILLRKVFKQLSTLNKETQTQKAQHLLDKIMIKSKKLQ